MAIHERMVGFPARSTSWGGASADVPASSETLIERVDRLIRAGKVPPVWGSPLVSTTPTPLAVEQLAVQAEALEKAVREIARAVQELSDRG